MELSDPVVWGSALTVLISIVVVVFLGFKIKALMDRDAQNK